MKIKIKYLEDNSEQVITVNKIEKVDNKIYFYETSENEFFELGNEIEIEILGL